MPLTHYTKNTITVRVTPNASSNRIKIETQEDNTSLIRIYVTTIPENGKANKSVIKLLAKALGIPKSALTLTHGATSKNKTFKINRSLLIHN